MKNKVKYILFLLIAIIFSVTTVNAKENDNITIYFFHGDGCPHCSEEDKFLSSLDNKYENIEIIKYEVWYNDENALLLNKVKDALNINSNGVPVTIIGTTPIVGYSEATASKIERAINYYQKETYQDVIVQIQNNTYKYETENKEEIKDNFTKEEEKSDKSSSISVPIIGKVNLKKLSVFNAAVLIGLVDGFNPCAMWILLFLLSVLIGMKDKKRMWILGLTFLTTSAFIYLLIMMSWLNIIVKVTTSIIIRNIIAIVAIVGGIINLRKFLNTKSSGCEVVDDKKRKKIFTRIKKFTHEKSFALALIGVIGLAISVNLVELACSAGLPIVFTQLLAINNIIGIKALFYTAIYILFFLLDDIIVFSVAMYSMKLTGISTKYNKYSHLLGGLIMLLIGILLILKPNWLMFNFN